MPTWFHNHLMIEGASSAAAALASAGPTTGLLEVVDPMPFWLLRNPEVSDADDARRWASDHWGTTSVSKAEGLRLAHVDDGDTRFWFSTSWGPPIAAVLQLANQYPEARLTLEYTSETGDIAEVLTCDTPDGVPDDTLGHWDPDEPSGDVHSPGLARRRHTARPLERRRRGAEVAAEITERWAGAHDHSQLVDDVAYVVDQKQDPAALMTLDQLRRRHRGAPRLLAELGWVCVNEHDLRATANRAHVRTFMHDQDACDRAAETLRVAAQQWGRGGADEAGHGALLDSVIALHHDTTTT